MVQMLLETALVAILFLVGLWVIQAIMYSIAGAWMAIRRLWNQHEMRRKWG